MGNLVLTVIFSLLLMGLVIGGLGIGLWLTGKSRLHKRCGMAPKEAGKKRGNCPVCGADNGCKRDEPPKQDSGDSR